MGELLAAAAEAMGVPEGLVERAAEARAKAAGATTEDVLRAWAGGGEIEASGPPAAEQPDEEAAPATAPAPAEAAEPEALEVEVVGGEEEAPEPEEAPPAAAPVEEPELEPEEEAMAAGALPRWLVALFVMVPAFAVAYALFLPNGPNCGDAGRLAVDPVTGVAVNCDSTEYGTEVIDFFAIGAEQYQLAGCAACHGPNGGGGGNFPPLADGELLVTFPEGECSQHLEWVRLGTTQWPDPTYGVNDKPVGGSGAIMPGFGQLTPEQLAGVVIFERVEFGGQDLQAALDECAPEDGSEAPEASG